MASLGNLVAGVAHEVNTPIGIGITAITHLKDKLTTFLSQYRSGEMKRSDLETYLKISDDAISIITHNLGHAAQLVKSFKEISVDQSGGDVREINLHEYLDRLLLSLRPNLKNTQVKVDIAGVDPAIRLTIEPGALAQVFTNLILNSLAHAFEDGQKGNIVISARAHNHQLQVIYTDDGKGIEKVNLNKIFDPFFTTKRNLEGSGLGMHIVYNIISVKFSGTIKVESELNKGVRFEINLPETVISSHEQKN